MTGNKTICIFLVLTVILVFSTSSIILQKSDNALFITKFVTPNIGLVGITFADSGEYNQQSGSENDQEHQSESNNMQSNQESNQTQSEHQAEHQSENNNLQFNQENNQTQPENSVTNENQNQTEHEGENANKTEAEHQAENEQTSTGEIENENNNLNATHNATEQDISDIAEAKTNQTIAAQVDIGAGNVSEKSIDNNVVVKVENTTNDAVNMTVSASSQSGPKVILINLNSTTIDVGNIKYLHIMYDGQPIAPAASVAEVLHPASSDQPHFAILITQSGAQVLISIPHFSTHTITITSLSKVISSVPEFGPLAAIVLVIAVVSTIAVSKTRLKL